MLAFVWADRYRLVPTIGVDIDVPPTALASSRCAKAHHPCVCLDEQKTWMPAFVCMTGSMAIRPVLGSNRRQSDCGQSGAATLHYVA